MRRAFNLRSLSLRETYIYMDVKDKETGDIETKKYKIKVDSNLNIKYEIINYLTYELN